MHGTCGNRSMLITTRTTLNRPVAVTAGLVRLCEILHCIHRSIYLGTEERTDKDVGKILLCQSDMACINAHS